ncbi:hypothetical protein FHS85_002839 [Rhodoligotrophos appendicifer]|uniref:hypothetical protein n=1 Tax=Rhodoligotrophos appendicifer TaxID=987056 RepID=UPI001186DC4D|nr:hypothetical protein [Rhodoligotrophos appendicifer]
MLSKAFASAGLLGLAALGAVTASSPAQARVDVVIGAPYFAPPPVYYPPPPVYYAPPPPVYYAPPPVYVAPRPPRYWGGYRPVYGPAPYWRRGYYR